MKKAVKSEEVDGILMDSYTTIFYEYNGKLASLFTANKIQIQKKVSVTFAKELQGLVDCLTFIRPTIDSSVEAITDTYKVSAEILSICKDIV